MESLIRNIMRGEDPNVVVERHLRQEQSPDDEFEITSLDTGWTRIMTRAEAERLFGRDEFAEIVAGYLPNIVAVQVSGAMEFLRHETFYDPKTGEEIRPFGYELDPEGRPIREPIRQRPPGADYGADPLPNGMFRMVPSGDIVDADERRRRLAESLQHEQEEPPVDADRGGYLPSQSGLVDDRLGEPPEPDTLFGFRGLSIGDRVTVVADEDPAYGRLGTVKSINEDETISVDLDEGNTRKFQSYELSLVASDTGIFTTEARMSFEDWMRKVDQAVGAKTGLSVYDLADMPYRDWYDSGMSPSSAAKRALASEGFESLKHEAFNVGDWVRPTQRTAAEFGMPERRDGRIAEITSDGLLLVEWPDGSDLFLAPEDVEMAESLKHEVSAGPLATARDIVTKWRSIGATNIEIRQEIRKVLSTMFPMESPENVERILHTLSL